MGVNRISEKVCNLIEKIEASIVKVTALVNLHFLAWQFDGDLIYACFDIDAVLVGVTWVNGKAKKEGE